MVTSSVDLETMDVGRAARALADGEFTAEELMAAVLQRARQTEPVVHAYVHLDEDAAMKAAAVSDVERAEGRPCGPLHGIPIGVKDMFATADMPTAAGSRVLAGHRPDVDAVAVARLRAAGALIVGKQWTHEFGCGLSDPPTRNPWDPTRYPGGSTVGGAVSVAVGSSLAALGADGGGSVRKPASINGLVGLKPTWGRVSLDGIVPGSGTTDHVGWLTRSVQDAALLLRVLAEDGDSSTGTVELGMDPDVWADLGVDGLRLGCPDHLFRELDPDIDDCTRRCLDALERAGATVVDLSVPELELAPLIHGTLAAVEAYPPHARWLAACPDEYGAGTRRSLQLGALIPGVDVLAAQSARRHLRTAVASAFEEHGLDAFCCPTLALGPVPLAGMDSARVLPRYTRNTLPFNVTGQPAISVPSGVSSDGMPVGFQIVGRPYDEATVLRVGRAVETAGPWTSPRPHVVST